CFVRRSLDSSTDATLDTGGWLALTRQGLSPCKMRRAFPSAIATEPKRLWRRYLWVVPSFLFLSSLQLMGLKKYSIDD
ncbi:MAG: hypothetical protein ACREYE_09370, partial [Gammaproteobacteria bacterium]